MLIWNPHTLFSNNGTQFVDKGVEKFLKSLEIKHRATFVEHPQSNGQTEAAYKVILEDLKKQVKKAKDNWAKELPVILWAYHFSPQSTTRETHFRLSYESNAIILIKVGEPSLQNVDFVEEENNEILKEALDVVEEIIKKVHIRAKLYKRRVEKRCNNRVKRRRFLKGGLVLRKCGKAQKIPEKAN